MTSIIHNLILEKGCRLQIIIGLARPAGRHSTEDITIPLTKSFTSTCVHVMVEATTSAVKPVVNTLMGPLVIVPLMKGSNNIFTVPDIEWSIFYGIWSVLNEARIFCNEELIPIHFFHTQHESFYLCFVLELNYYAPHILVPACFHKCAHLRTGFLHCFWFDNDCWRLGEVNFRFHQMNENRSIFQCDM